MAYVSLDTVATNTAERRQSSAAGCGQHQRDFDDLRHGQLQPMLQVVTLTMSSGAVYDWTAE